MSYTPPAGDAANFSWAGQSPYTPPAGNAANFAWPGSAVLSYWDGSAWIPGVLKRWSGSAWVLETIDY
jgi:hypothetical protein